MYWLSTAETDPLSLGTIKGTKDFVTDFASALKTAFDPLITEKFFLKLESDARAASSKMGNQFASNVGAIQNMIVDIYTENVKLGFEYKDTAAFLTSLAGEMGRMVSFTKESTTNAIMLSKAMGVSAEEVGKMYASFMKYGMSQQKAQEVLNKTFEVARKNGVDAAKLTKTISEDIYKAQIYGFKDGVEGLTKMAIQAQRLGIEMKVAAGAADRAFDPEGAIEMASSLQMLGGAMGGMTDVGQLMYMAQSDVGALQDSILKSTASMVDFNKTTGEFKISPEMRRNMTDYAKSINSSYEEVAKNAVKARKEQEVLSKLPMTGGFSEEEKSMIASLAEIGPNGQVQIKLPGTDKLIDVSELKGGSAQMAELKKAQDEASKSSEEVAKDQLSVMKQVSNTLMDIKLQGVRAGGKKEDSSEKRFSDLMIEENKMRANETTMGYDKLENQMEPVLKAELEAFTSTMSVVTNELSGALKSPELSKGLEVLGAAATIGFTAIETSVKLLADLLKGDADAAKTEIENSYDKIETETKSVLNKLGIDTEELINKIKEQKESLGEKFPVLKLLSSNETSSPENITSNTIPNNVNLTNQDLTNNNLTNQTITPNNTNQNIGIDNKGIENILTFAGESKITIELNSNIPANLLDKVLNEQEVTAVVKEEIRKTFDKSTNNSIINAIPIKIDMG
jgi:hypothetical protein